MKLDCVLTAVNENKLYIEFIEFFIKTWNKLYPNVDVKIVLVAKKIPDEFSEYKNNIILFEPIDNISTSSISQIIRLFYPAILNYKNGVLITDIDMKILGGPYLKYCDNIGNRGLTAVTIIETSHIAMHVWDEDNPALVQLDVYSCKDLDVEIVFSYLYKFKPVRMSYRYFDRETNFKLIKVQNEYKTSKKN